MHAILGLLMIDVDRGWSRINRARNDRPEHIDIAADIHEGDELPPFDLTVTASVIQRCAGT